MINTLGPFDPTTAYPQQIDTQIGDALGVVIVHNLGPYELKVKWGDGNTSLVGAWGFRRFDISYPTPRINWMIAATPSQSNPPLSVLFLETSDRRDDLPPVYFGTYTRQTSIGNNVNTTGSGGTTFIQNDGNAPATSIIESTPNDQAVSAESWNNDASGLEQILSAGAQRIVRQNTRGNATIGHATVQFGDANEPSMTTLYGKIGAGSTVPASVVTGTLPASQVGSGYPAADLSGAVPSATDAANLEVSGLTGLISASYNSTNNTLTLSIPHASGGAVTVDFDVTTPTGDQFTTTFLDQYGEIYSDIVRGGGYTSSDVYGFPTGSSGVRWRATTTFSGTGPGTYNHGFASLSGGGTPNYIGITSTEANSTQTVGVDTIGSSTCHVNMPNAWPFVGLAART